MLLLVGALFVFEVALCCGLVVFKLFAKGVVWYALWLMCSGDA